MNAAYLPLTNCPSEVEQLEIIQNIWNKERLPHQLRLYKSFLEHFRNEISRLQQNLKYRQQSSLASRLDVKYLICVFRFLSEHRDLSLSSLLQKAKLELEGPQIKDIEVQKVIELCFRAFLTVNIRSDSDARTDAPTIGLPIDESTLSTFLGSIFPKSDYSITAERRLAPDFKIVNIVNGCGLKIIWTTFLADHLRVDRVKKIVRIYHLKQCLDDHLNARGNILSANGSLLPADLLRETIWTLNVLFPEELATAELLRAHRHHHAVGINAESGQRPWDLNMSDWGGDTRRPLDLSAYRFWGERLLDLLSIYEEGPTTLRQYLAYQKPYQVFNWVAALIASVALALVFGMISSVTSIISTNATLKALEVAKEALELQKNTPPLACS